MRKIKVSEKAIRITEKIVRIIYSKINIIEFTNEILLIPLLGAKYNLKTSLNFTGYPCTI